MLDVRANAVDALSNRAVVFAESVRVAELIDIRDREHRIEQERLPSR